MFREVHHQRSAESSRTTETAAQPGRAGTRALVETPARCEMAVQTPRFGAVSRACLLRAGRDIEARPKKRQRRRIQLFRTRWMERASRELIHILHQREENSGAAPYAVIRIS